MKRKTTRSSKFISHNSGFIIVNCEFISCNSEKKVRIARKIQISKYKLAIARKKKSELRYKLQFLSCYSDFITGIWVYIVQFWEKKKNHFFKKSLYVCITLP